MKESIPYGFSIKSKSSFLKLTYQIKDIASKKLILEVEVTRGMWIPIKLIMYDLNKKELLRAYKTGIFSPRYILKQEEGEIAEFWVESKLSNDKSELLYKGKVLTNKSNKLKEFHFKDIKENEFFSLEMKYRKGGEYLVEVSENFDPPLAIIISCILIINYR